MTTPRAEYAALLAGILPTSVVVVPYARDITPERDTVMVRLDRVAPADVAKRTRRRYEFGLVLVTPLTDDTGPADDALDGLLEDVLHAIETHPQLSWSSAERGVYAGTSLPSYEVNTAIGHEKEHQP